MLQTRRPRPAQHSPAKVTPRDRRATPINRTLARRPYPIHRSTSVTNGYVVASSGDRARLDPSAAQLPKLDTRVRFPPPALFMPFFR